MKNKICIRAEGGAEIGMGHIMRMLELAHILSKELDVVFASKYDIDEPERYSAGINAVKTAGYPVILLSNSKFYHDLNSIEANALLTDSYDVSKEYFEIAKKKFNFNIYFDDDNIMKCPFFNVDMLVNQNIYAKKINYKASPTTEKLLGLEYLILRDEFIGNKKKIIKPQIENIMITVGASDYRNITEKIIQELLPLHYHLRIIVGSAFIYADDLVKYSSQEVEICFNANMSECMKWCDVAITACGTTAYEMIAMGVPALGLAIVDNQKFCCDYMNDNGLLIRSSLDNIYRDINLLTVDKRSYISNCGRAYIDGEGKYRIAKRIVDRLTCN